MIADKPGIDLDSAAEKLVKLVMGFYLRNNKDAETDIEEFIKQILIEAGIK